MVFIHFTGISFMNSSLSFFIIIFYNIDSLSSVHDNAGSEIGNVLSESIESWPWFGLSHFKGYYNRFISIYSIFVLNDPRWGIIPGPFVPLKACESAAALLRSACRNGCMTCCSLTAEDGASGMTPCGINLDFKQHKSSTNVLGTLNFNVLFNAWIEPYTAYMH